jgi:hypothetical protein
MGLIITINEADYSDNALSLPQPPINFDKLSIGVSDVTYNSNTKNLSVVTSNSPSFFEFAQTSEAISAKIRVPALNSVTIHALCIGADINGNAIVLNLNGDGAVRKFGKSGNLADLVNLYTIPTTPPNTPKGNEVTITHGTTYVTIAYFGYTFNLLYSHVPTLVTKSIGVLATGLGASTYTFEKLL